MGFAMVQLYNSCYRPLNQNKFGLGSYTVFTLVYDRGLDTNMYYVYVLQSKQTKKCYTGYSSNLKERMKDHFSHSVHTTKRMGELVLIFYEAYLLKSDTQRREMYLKTTNGKRALKLMLADYFLNCKV